MEFTLQIPDVLARRLKSAGDDLERRAVEGLALEEYKSGHMTKPELRRLPGFETRYEFDGFLKRHRVFDQLTLDDIRQDLGDLESLGL